MAKVNVKAAPYMMLTKPGIIMGNGITTAGGFILASKGSFNPWLFFAAMLGLSLVIASACVFNNYLDRHIDEKMQRTKKRPLVLGIIPLRAALAFGLALGLGGAGILLFYTNPLALSIALFGFAVYVLLYTLLKTKTVHGTLIGSVAGAVPPVVGYCAASGTFDTGAFLFFLIMALWQIPHFFAIAIYRLKDYEAANIPVLPLTKGFKRTKIHMLIYTLAFTLACTLLTVAGYTGIPFLIVSLLLGLAWLAVCIEGFFTTHDAKWARKVFRTSLIVIMGLCLTIPLDTFFS